MEDRKGFSVQIENWLSRVPGIRTYKQREHRRETDKKLRAHLASRLQEARSSLKRLTLDFSQRGELDHLDELDRLSSRLQQMADTIRYASYGWAGIFDLEKVREEELDRLYALDLSLLDHIEKIQAEMTQMAPKIPLEQMKAKLVEISHLLDHLEGKFRQRTYFLSRTS